MAKQQKAKTASGGRNPDRTNGKAWGRNSGSATGHQGHNETGRTKPSGNTVGGHSMRKLSNGAIVDLHAIDIKDSRDTQHRKAVRRARKAQTVAPATDVRLSLVK